MSLSYHTIRINTAPLENLTISHRHGGDPNMSYRLYIARVSFRLRSLNSLRVRYMYPQIPGRMCQGMQIVYFNFTAERQISKVELNPLLFTLTPV
jgi:hypothetical protein